MYIELTQFYENSGNTRVIKMNIYEQSSMNTGDNEYILHKQFIWTCL